MVIEALSGGCLVDIKVGHPQLISRGARLGLDSSTFDGILSSIARLGFSL